MRRTYSLAPYNGIGATLDFDWDPETGEVGGRDGADVRAWAEEAKRAGYRIGDPHPTPYVMIDPLRRPSEMAVLLGSLWRLPPDLAAQYPRSTDATPPGAVN